MSVNDVFPSCLSESLYMMFGMQDLLRKSIFFYLGFYLYGGYPSHLLHPVTMAMLVKPTFDTMAEKCSNQLSFCGNL